MPTINQLVRQGRKKSVKRTNTPALQACPLIAVVVVIGDGRPYVTALVSVNPEATEGMTSDEIRAGVQTAIDEVNSRNARSHQIKRFTILDEPLSMERGELTPTLKVRRRVVREHFSETIDQLYPTPE